MKKRDDIEEIDDEIIDDEIIDDDEIVDDVEEVEEERPRRSAPRAQKAQNKKKGLSKGAKIGIISGSAAVGVIAIALVALFVILPALGINIFSKKAATYDGPSVTKDI